MSMISSSSAPSGKVPLRPSWAEASPIPRGSAAPSRALAVSKWTNEHFRQLTEITEKLLFYTQNESSRTASHGPAVPLSADPRLDDAFLIFLCLCQRYRHLYPGLQRVNFLRDFRACLLGSNKRTQPAVGERVLEARTELARRLAAGEIAEPLLLSEIFNLTAILSETPLWDDIPHRPSTPQKFLDQLDDNINQAHSIIALHLPVDNFTFVYPFEDSQDLRGKSPPSRTAPQVVSSVGLEASVPAELVSSGFTQVLDILQEIGDLGIRRDELVRRVNVRIEEAKPENRPPNQVCPSRHTRIRRALLNQKLDENDTELRAAAARAAAILRHHRPHFQFASGRSPSASPPGGGNTAAASGGPAPAAAQRKSGGGRRVHVPGSGTKDPKPGPSASADAQPAKSATQRGSPAGSDVTVSSDAPEFLKEEKTPGTGKRERKPTDRFTPGHSKRRLF